MKAAIFDLDGTLLDSMGVWEGIDIDFLTGRGFDVPSDYVQAIAAMGFHEVARYTIERFGLSDTPEELLRQWNDMAVYAYGHTVPLKPYAREYLDVLKARGFKLAVATSLPAELYGPAMAHLGLYDYFDVVCSTTEGKYNKQEPHIYLLAAQRLGVDPGDCVVFEDILEAIVGAKAAGMAVYGVYDPASAHNWEAIQKAADGALDDFRDAPLPT